MIRLHILKAYAHRMPNAKEDGFKALSVVENIVEYLAQLYNGQTDCSSDGTIQSPDTLKLYVSDDCIAAIEKEYPFINESYKSKYMTGDPDYWFNK